MRNSTPLKISHFRNHRKARMELYAADALRNETTIQSKVGYELEVDLKIRGSRGSSSLTRWTSTCQEFLRYCTQFYKVEIY